MSISLVNLCVDADGGQRILTDITVDFPTGAITLVIGAPGSGKSTLLQTLAGLLPVASGRIEVDGTPLWNGRSPNKAALLQLGMVFQHPEDQLFCATVEKELRYSLRPYHLPDTAASAAIRNSLAAVDLPDEMLHRFPLTLSGGQKRRVALACTWAPEPRWLLLDEPTAGIDPRASAHLLQVLAERRRGRADGGAVIATHDLNPLLPLADWVLVLYEGRLIFAGTPETLVERPEVLELAEVGLPTALTVAQALQARGITLGSTPLTPRAVAAELMRARNQARSPATQPPAAASRPTADVATHLPAPIPPAAENIPSQESRAAAWLTALDMRAKWLSYLVLSMTLLTLHTVAGLVAGYVITLGILWRARVPGRHFGILRPVLVLLGLTVILSGLRWTGGNALHLGYSAANGWRTALSLAPVLPVVALGIPLAQTSSALDVKRGLERLWIWKRRPPLVESLLLGAALTLRFIPLMWEQWRRFAKMVQARGKSATRPGRMRMRDVPAVAIPLILSILHLGDTLATALEARGYRDDNPIRTRPPKARWTRREWSVVGGCLAVCCALWWFGHAEAFSSAVG